MDLRERTTSTRHPWEEVRARFFLDVLGDLARGRRVLDVGAGDAYFARRVVGEAGAREVVAWDAGYRDADLDELRSARVVPVREPPPGRFDVVTMMDVLEHVDDDAGMLAEVARERLADGGVVLASAPAWPMLYGAHDAALGHVRRYVPSRFRRLFPAAGLSVEASGGLFASLPLARALSVLRERLGPAREPRLESAWDHGTLATAIVRAALSLDASASRRWPRLPGLSVWVLARRAS